MDTQTFLILATPHVNYSTKRAISDIRNLYRKAKTVAHFTVEGVLTVVHY